MPTFRDINQFNAVADAEVNPDWTLQVSATQRVTLKQIAALAVSKGDTIKLDGYSLSSDANKKSLTSTTTITDAFERLMQMLGGGYNDDYSKLQVISKKSTYLYHILRLMETVSNKNLDLISDPVNQVFGLLFNNTGVDPTTALTSAFKFKAIPWSSISSGTGLGPNQIHSAGSTVAVALTKASWDAVNIGSSVVVVASGTSKTLSAIVTTLVANVKSTYQVYTPTSDQYDLLDTSTNAHIILVQKLGTYIFVTVSPMVKA